MKTKHIIVMLLVAAVAASILLWQKNKKLESQNRQVFTPKSQSQEKPKEGLGAQVYEKSQNPVKDQVPETNPFKGAKTNPIEGSYKNPFE